MVIDKMVAYIWKEVRSYLFGAALLGQGEYL